MDTARLFTNGGSQAVRLPKEYRFDGDEVAIRRLGTAVVLLPKGDPWGVLFDALGDFTPDLHLVREDTLPQERGPIG